ncbi:N-acetylglucosamine repressor [Pantoea sp. PA1]|jgi:hypothetical protein|uniref:NagC family transcriptional regulator n=1 Tax=Pantoea ananas TaxID=553 RepID=A0A8A4K6Z7_PANAN|nr:MULTISPECIES: hypothetical protein [Pantoea]MBA4823329.1 NagC family transcriptional regulator [Pantoea ananatis]MCV3301007.1 NagC family transcriptional regulator [Pantoea ananatis]MDC7869386.1 NagC family transcriptional regulator [Pantoea ananatis]MDH0053364.1 NagC family transcriptional regulator [Pantoea ananatis]MDI3367383.1 NagC family transcriptional regulator [Pantoea sp. V108_6]
MDYKKQILNILHSECESRAEMTRRLGVTKAYVTKLTSQLLEERVIEERDVKDSAFGRPQQLLAATPGQFFSVNITLRKGQLQAMLNDFNTQVPALAHHRISLPALLTPQRLVAFIATSVAALCLSGNVRQQQVNVISVALQGGIEHFTGVVRYCPLFSETNVALKKRIEDAMCISTQIFNIAFCTTFQLAQRLPYSSWVAFMPGFGSLGYGQCIHGEPVLGENGFYPEIVHLPYEGGIEQAFAVDPDNQPATVLATARALCFAICCTAPIHNIRHVIVTGELFEDYGDEVLPLAQAILAANADTHISGIRIKHDKTGYHYGVKGLVQLSSDAITEHILP